MRHNVQLWLVRKPAPEIHCAFHGWPVSLLELSFFRVSLWPRIPQESSCISSARIGSLPITNIVYWNKNVALTSPGERRAVTPRKYKSIFFVRCKSCRSLPCPAGTARVWRLEGSGFLPERLKPRPRKASARSDPGRPGLLIPQCYVAVYIFCPKQQAIMTNSPSLKLNT